MVASSLIQARKGTAEDIIKRARSEGHKLGCISGMKTYLQDWCKVSEAPLEFFDILTDGDLCDLYIKASENNVVFSPTGESSTATGRITPPSSDVCAEDQNDSQRHRQQSKDGSQGETDESPISPTYDDSELSFWTKVLMPHTGNLELASARRSREKESYISRAIIECNNLFQHVTTDETIRLTWHALNCSTSKARSTRFKVVPDVDIEYNMVVGTGCYDPDENDLDVPTRELEQGLELGGHFQSEPSTIPRMMLQNAAVLLFDMHEEYERRGTQKRLRQNLSSDPDPGNKRSRLDIG